VVTTELVSPVGRRADRVSTRALRVAMVLESTAMGGCPVNAVDLARALRARGHEISLYAIDQPVVVSFLPYAERMGFPVGLLPTHATLTGRAAQLRSLAVSNGMDVVHVFAAFLGLASTVALAASPRRATIVTNWDRDNALWLPRHTPVVVGTRTFQEEMRARHRTDVWLLEPMVDLELDRPDPAAGEAFRASIGVGADEVLLALVGRVDRVMKLDGILHSIGAVGHLDDPRLRLAVVGDGNAMAQARAHAATVNAALGREAVLLTGALADPHPAYAAADVALAMGGSALRALAHAKPVIVLGENGFARAFGPDSTGYFYEAGFFGKHAVAEPERHLGGLVRELMDPARRAALGDFGREQVEERFSLAAAARAQEEMYLAALAGPGVPARLADAGLLLAKDALHRTRSRIRGLRVTSGPRSGSTEEAR
jgi:glycosyltransferase involved in cell wall biosynthesis